MSENWQMGYDFQIYHLIGRYFYMRGMKNFLILGSVLFPMAAFADSKATVSGSSFSVIEIKPEASTGLNNIFVVNDAKGCIFTYKASDGYKVTVYRYSNLGGGYAEEITDIDRQSTKISFPLGTDDMGYIIEDGSSRYYCWVVNYSNHVMTLSDVSPSEDSECDYSVLRINGSAPPINYYTINGQPRVLSREIHIDYQTQQYDEESHFYTNVEERKVLESLGNVVSLSPPAYGSTYFTVSGDRFLREWNMEIVKDTPLVQPQAVDCRTEALQDEYEGSEGSNIMKGESNGLGGSAPADISFYAYVTDAVRHYEWQMSRDQNFENPDYRFYQQDLDYTFVEEGTFYLRFIGSNADGTCECFGDTYTVTIGASALECPNAFSPNDDGINDIWKISYRSLIEFHCEIFNRNGQKIYGYDDPSGGWDGTWHGKKVRPGVYYYVITATGADGKQYKKSGDINIINSVIYDNGTMPPSSEE